VIVSASAAYRLGKIGKRYAVSEGL